MVKNKEWLKEEIKNLYKVTISPLISGSVNINSVLSLIDQMEEPNVSNETVKDILKANKEMSKRIKELEDEIESETNFYTFDDAKKWLEKNGYVVTEKEQLYRVVLGSNDLGYKYTALDSYGDIAMCECISEAGMFTEKEIKDHDERFWQFAVPVEEEAE